VGGGEIIIIIIIIKKELLTKPTCRWRVNIKINLKEIR